jgi:hypothetical protein
VVPHKRLAVTTSFRSFSGFPAAIKGHVCRREEGGRGKWTWRRGEGWVGGGGGGGGGGETERVRWGQAASLRGQLPTPAIYSGSYCAPQLTKAKGSRRWEWAFWKTAKRAHSGFQVKPWRGSIQSGQVVPQSRADALRSWSRAAQETVRPRAPGSRGSAVLVSLRPWSGFWVSSPSLPSSAQCRLPFPPLQTPALTSVLS